MCEGFDWNNLRSFLCIIIAVTKYRLAERLYIAPHHNLIDYSR